jgi:hypothetical protein
MARIRETLGRSDGESGYGRLFGVDDLGVLISRVHATSIRNGNELEEMLRAPCPFRACGLEERLLQTSLGLSRRVEAYFQESVKTGHPPRPAQFDVLVVDNEQRTALVVEIKDGDAFDTKKSDGELECLQRVAARVGECLRYETAFQFCCFNQTDKDAIMRGAKMRFGPAEVMTGPELCRLLQVDYDAICQARRADAEDNLDYFLAELAAIPRVRERLQRALDGRLF